MVTEALCKITVNVFSSGGKRCPEVYESSVARLRSHLGEPLLILHS
ncbi:hypothetical protein [Candidatus Hamiltonella defensa]|nr:hypothetical protein [Candidatus Hamiltonella defensa]